MFSSNTTSSGTLADGGWFVVTRVSNSQNRICAIKRTNTIGYMVGYDNYPYFWPLDLTTGNVNASQGYYDTNTSNTMYVGGNYRVGFYLPTTGVGFNYAYVNDFSTQEYWQYHFIGFSAGTYAPYFVWTTNKLWMFDGIYASNNIYWSAWEFNGSYVNPLVYTYGNNTNTKMEGVTVTPDETKIFAGTVQYSSGGTFLTSINPTNGQVNNWYKLDSGTNSATKSNYVGLAATNTHVYVGRESRAYKFTADLNGPTLVWGRNAGWPSGITQATQAYDNGAGIYCFVTSKTVLTVMAAQNSSTSRRELLVTGYDESTGIAKFQYRVYSSASEGISFPVSDSFSQAKRFPPITTDKRAIVPVFIGSSSWGMMGSLIALPLDNALADGSYQDNIGYVTVSITNTFQGSISATATYDTGFNYSDNDVGTTVYTTMSTRYNTSDTSLYYGKNIIPGQS